MNLLLTEADFWTADRSARRFGVEVRVGDRGEDDTRLVGRFGPWIRGDDAGVDGRGEGDTRLVGRAGLWIRGDDAGVDGRGEDDTRLVGRAGPWIRGDDAGVDGRGEDDTRLAGRAGPWIRGDDRDGTLARKACRTEERDRSNDRGEDFAEERLRDADDFLS